MILPVLTGYTNVTAEIAWGENKIIKDISDKSFE